MMSPYEYALIVNVAQREGGLENVLSELARKGALEAINDDEAQRTLYRVRKSVGQGGVNA